MSLDHLDIDVVLFSWQVSECEELHETVASLKQQLSEALELRNFSPVVSHPEKATETKNLPGEISTDNGNTELKDKNDMLLLQIQVFSPFLVVWVVIKFKLTRLMPLAHALPSLSKRQKEYRQKNGLQLGNGVNFSNDSL